MRPSALLLLLCTAFGLAAQPFDAKRPPNTYRNADNPDYWKNRPPYAGYWQQDVHYVIKGRLDDERDQLDADLTLYYNNNSPDTLRWVFFHLYQQAYEPGSYADLLDNEGRPSSPRVDRVGTVVHSIADDTTPLRSEQDNTVVKVWLNAPLPPGERATFRIRFTTHWAMDVQRRMKLFNAWGSKHYDGVHWYPRIAVYDRRMGWDTQQHLGNELYGDFGTFDVDLDLPHHYVLDATGWLQNIDDVLPADLRRKLDISNFKDKPWNEPPSVILAPDTNRRKVWRFHAENVHDFAFTADPTYRIGEASWNGIKCVALVQEPHASGWQNAADYTARIIEVFSTDFGAYAYPKMIVADARDGMEYPMLTLDGGRDPDYRGLLVHEVGHNWFYGMLGNNETYRAFMDEGFTQFLTAWGLERIDGDTLVSDPPRTAYERRHLRPERPRDSEIYNAFQRDAVRDRLPAINTHSDEFGYWERRDKGGYGHAYTKTATMLYNLQYVLGDPVFLAAMRHYVDQWRTCHPYPEDMQQSFTDATKRDLSWFFDGWITTDKRIDYAVGRITGRLRNEGQSITLHRRGELPMPLDLQVVARDGRRYDFHIPNNWDAKPTSAQVLPRWIGYDDLQRSYTARVNIPSGIEDVIIDTTLRLGDANLLNNRARIPTHITFDHHLRQPADRSAYEGFVRPDVWWNGFDGIKAGVHFRSSYMRYKHRLWASAWLNTGILQYLPPGHPSKVDTIPGSTDTSYGPISFNLRYRNGTERLLRGSSVELFARVLDGLERYGGHFEWDLPNDKTTASVSMVYLLRRDSSDRTYLLQPDLWELDRLNGYVEAALRHRYWHRSGRGDLRAELRSSAVGSQSRYAWLRMSSVHVQRLGGLELRTRGMAQYGSGSIPRESALYLAGASPEELMENKYVRSIGFVPYEFLGFGGAVNHFAQGGGLGLRGYAGYLAPELVDGELIFTHLGHSGVAASAELDLDGLVRWRPGKVARYLHLDVYLFGDVGSMGYRQARGDDADLRFAPVRADAGLGAAFTIKRFGPLVDIEPLTIRIDLPLLLSALPAGESDHFGFRYVVGIGRTF